MLISFADVMLICVTKQLSGAGKVWDWGVCGDNVVGTILNGLQHGKA